MDSFLTQSSGRKKGAFSLTELMAVIAVIAVVATLLVPSVSSIFAARSLRYSVERSWGVLSGARAEAITSGSPVAVVLMDPSGLSVLSGREEPAALVLLRAKAHAEPDGTVSWDWKALTGWIQIPLEIQIEPSFRDATATTPEAARTFYRSSDTPSLSSYAGLSPVLPKWKGSEIQNYFYVVFRPDGSVDAPSGNPTLELKRLRTGVTRLDSTLIVNSDSGRTRLVEL